FYINTLCNTARFTQLPVMGNSV
ncbi:hypothetical protein MPH_14086, partial [Macrophomina phaseolina MS6]